MEPQCIIPFRKGVHQEQTRAIEGKEGGGPTGDDGQAGKEVIHVVVSMEADDRGRAESQSALAQYRRHSSCLPFHLTVPQFLPARTIGLCYEKCSVTEQSELEIVTFELAERVDTDDYSDFLGKTMAGLTGIL